MRFAVLEDDPARMEVLTGWLRKPGTMCVVSDWLASDARSKAVRVLTCSWWDWVLPDLTGEQVLRWLRVERGNDTPAIFITSRDAEEDIANAFSAGADDYLIAATAPDRTAVADRGGDAPLPSRAPITRVWWWRRTTSTWPARC